MPNPYRPDPTSADLASATRTAVRTERLHRRAALPGPVLALAILPGTLTTREGRMAVFAVGLQRFRVAAPQPSNLPEPERHYRRLRGLKAVTNGLA